MIKIRIHVDSGHTFMDNNIFIDCVMPSVPRKGDFINLFSIVKDLESQVNTVELLETYKEYVFKGKAYFGDCFYINSIQFTPNSDIVQIEVSPDKPSR